MARLAELLGAAARLKTLPRLGVAGLGPLGLPAYVTVPAHELLRFPVRIAGEPQGRWVRLAEDGPVVEHDALVHAGGESGED